MIPTLHTERLVLRAIEEADIPAFIDFFARSDVEVGAYRRRPAAEAEAKVRGWRAEWDKGRGLWAVEAEGAVIGAAGLTWAEDFPSHELTWVLFPEARGKGYAAEASRAAIAWGYDILGWDPVETYIRDHNEPARRLALRLGGRIIRRETFPDGVTRDVFALPHPGRAAQLFPNRIETARLVLRRPIAADHAAYTAFGMGERTAFSGGPSTEESATKNLYALMGQWEARGFGRYVITRRDNGRPIGHCGPIQYHDAHPMEMSWTLWSGEDEGHGFALEASAAVRDVWLALPDAPPMIAMVDHQNHRSIAVAEKLGGVRDDAFPKPHWSDKALIYRYGGAA